MLDSIYQLGLKQEEGHDNIVSLLTPTLAKYVIGIIFHNKAGGSIITYDRSELLDFEKSKESWYLFRRSSGRPDRGVFLTCDVSRKEIDKIRKNFLKSHSIDNLEIQEFIRKKIRWFPHGQLVNNKSLFDTLNNNRKQELCNIFAEFERNSEKISTDVIQTIIKIEPQITLLTIMISSDDNVEGGVKFVGQIKDYVNFFKDGILSKKYKSSEELYCSVCNKKKFIETFNERPLPFYFADNPLFFPDGQYSQSKKGFPVCDDCYLIIQKGVKFIYNDLNYSISELGSNKRELNFWLIPHLNDQEVIVYFKDELEKNKNLYLNTLKDLCSTLKIISRRDQHDRKNVEAFLRFSALFFTFDRYYIRIINYIQGIYPSQLEKLFDIKSKVDSQYPFPSLSLKFKKEPFLVGFPLLIFFYKEKDKKANKKKATQSKWQIQVTSVLARIFTGQPVILDEVIHKINTKVRKNLLRSFDLESLSHTIFLGLMLLEYLISLYDGQNHEKMSEPQTPITKEIEHVQKFIESHNNILSDGNRRAIFAVGICVGILLQVQELRYDKTAPFWNRLNRLDMDFERVIELLPEVKAKLAMYNERKHDTIINYLAVNEISRIEDDTISQSLSKDSINLIFSIGLSYGYMLSRDFIVQK